MKRLLPWVVLSVFLIYIAAELFGPVRSPGGFNIGEFSRLPVLINGRVQPIDSVARLALVQIRGTVDVPLEDAKGGGWRIWKWTPTLNPTEWLLEVLMKPAAADTLRIFPIQDPTVLKKLQLEAAGRTADEYYAYNDLYRRADELGKEAARIAKLKPGTRAAWETHWVQLRNALILYDRLKNSLQPNTIPARQDGARPAYDFATRLDDYRTNLVKAAIPRPRDKQQPIDQATADAIREFVTPFAVVSRFAVLSVIPPSDPVQRGDHWENVGTTIVNSARTGKLPVAVSHYAAMSSAYAQGKAEVFNAELAKYHQWLQKAYAPELGRIRSEFFNNRFRPFVRAAAIYLATLILLSAFWVTRSTGLYRSALGLLVLAGVLHTTGLVVDMMIEGRLPISNVYGWIVGSGWIVVLLAALVERFRRDGIGLTTAAVAGLIALSIAHGLGRGGAVQWVRAVVDLDFLFASVALGIVGIIVALAGRGGSSGSEGPASHSVRRNANGMRSPRRAATA